jgi:hypothetical protein
MIHALALAIRPREWKGIEATEKLAAPPNAQIVVVGNHKGNLPAVSWL